MQYNRNLLKNYQNVKIKNYLKSNTLFFIFQSSKPDQNNWKKKEQDLIKLKLKNYKVANKIFLKIIQNSIYKKCIYIVNGIILIINFKSKLTFFDFKFLQKRLNNSFDLLALKLNNNIYSFNQLKNKKISSYSKNLFFLHQTLEKYLKTSYIITKN